MNRRGSSMIFTPEHCDLVLAGKKTQTRRLVKPDEYFTRARPAGETGVYVRVSRVVNWYDKKKWIIGRTYAIKRGRGKPAQGRFRLLGIRKEQLQQITVEDVEAEGAERTKDMLGHECYRMPGVHNPWAFPQMVFEQLWDSINKTKGTRWADNPSVWVLEFELVS